MSLFDANVLTFGEKKKQEFKVKNLIKCPRFCF